MDGPKPLAPHRMKALYLFWTLLALVLLCQLLLLINAGANNQQQLNSDGVSYIRIATYYARGQADLMVSGTWSPLLSWIIAPLLAIADDPLVAARIAMGASAVVFAVGSFVLFCKLELGAVAATLGAAIVALASVPWSCSEITPDLLMAGLFCLGAAYLFSAPWAEKWKAQCAAGVFFGFAYLAKAVALPAFGLLLLLVSATWIVCRKLTPYQAGRSFLITLGAFLCIAGPWIAILSVTYQRPTFSTTAGYAHAIIGPDFDMDAFQYRFRQPPEGRISVFEDHCSLLEYERWSPLGSLDNFVYQVTHVYWTSIRIARFLGEFQWIPLGIFSLIAGLLLHIPWRDNMISHRWRWSGLAALALVAIYLPVGCSSRRYLWVLLPFLYAATVGVVRCLTKSTEDDSTSTIRQRIGLALVTVSFVTPFLIPTARAVMTTPQKPPWLVLAEAIEQHDIRGSLAGNDGRTLYVAFRLEQPFYGFKPDADPQAFIDSGAELIVVNRSSAGAAQLAADPRFDDLDPLLFASPDEVESCPLRVFRSPPHAGTQ